MDFLLTYYCIQYIAQTVDRNLTGERKRIMADKTCSSCIDNDNGLCDRKGILVEEDDTCEEYTAHAENWCQFMMRRFTRVY